MDILLDEVSKTITVKQKWRYNWQSKTGKRWTIMEKRNFHNRIDQLIWNKWGHHYQIGVKGHSEFAQKNLNEKFTLYFDIKWVLGEAHWEVTVEKIKKNSFETSYVNWNDRKIKLDTEDINLTEKISNGQTRSQYPVLHEFGHAVGNSTYASANMHGDEYKSTSNYYKDYSSMMNIGNELRKRHIDFLLIHLNQLLPNTIFYV